MLPHIGSDNGIIVAIRGDRFQQGSRCQSLFLRQDIQFFGMAHRFLPFRTGLIRQSGKHFFQNILHIAAQFDVRCGIFTDFGVINIHMDDLFPIPVAGNVAGGTIGKPDAQRQDQITFFLNTGGTPGPVHTAHTEIPFMVPGKCRQPHHTERYGCRKTTCQQCQLFTCSGSDNTAARIDHGAFRAVESSKGICQIQFRQRLEEQFLRKKFRIFTKICLNAFGNIHQHRAGSAGNGDFEGGIQHAGKLPDIADRKIVLDDLLCDPHDVDFLKAVPSQQRDSHISGDGNQRHAVKISIGDPGHKIGRTRTAGGDDHARLAGDPGKTIGCMCRILLMSAQYVVDTMCVFVQFIINGQDCTARITEYRLNTVAA